MVSKRLSESELKYLHERKHHSETRKRELINYLEKLKEAYRSKKIPFSKYLEIIHHKREGRTIEEWIHFYHFESLECHKRIKQHHSHVGKKNHLIFILACIVGLFLISLIFNNSNFAGFFTQEENASQTIITPYIQNVNIDFSENSEYEWQLENPGQLNSVRLSGAIEGDGEAKVYLNDILVLNTLNVKEQSTRSITGLVAENDTTTEEIPTEPETETRDIPVEEPEPETAITPSEEINETPIEEENQTKTENITEQPASEPETEIKTFTDICEETCNLESLNLNESSYTLRIEIDSATLSLSEIKYSLIEQVEEIPEEETNLTMENFTLQIETKNSRGELISSEIDMFDENGNEIAEKIEEGRGISSNEEGRAVFESEASISNELIVSPDSNKIKQIKFEKLKHKKNASIVLGIDDSIPEDNSSSLNVIATYAIDPSQMDFKQAEVTAIAQGNELYKCKDWNFTEQTCYGNWTFLQSITPGMEYTFALTPEDPGFAELVSQNYSFDIDTTPIDNATFVTAYVSADRIAYFKVYNTDGTIISNGTIDSANLPLYPRIAVEAINTTHFVVAWINDHDTVGNIANITVAIYKTDGTKLTSDVIVDDNIATVTSDSCISDLSIAEMGDRFVVGWEDDYESDASFKIFYNNATNITGIIDVDPTVSVPSPLSDFISVSTINSTRFVFGWWDLSVNDLAFIVYNELGTEVVARVNVDPSAGSDGRASVAGLDNDKFVYAFYLANDQDIGYTLVYKNGTALIGNTIIEPNAGPTTGTWLDVAAVKADNYANDSFVLIWYNATAGNIIGTTYYGNGTNIAKFTIDTEENTNYRLMSVVGKEAGTGQQICPGRFIVAYSNSSNVTTLKKFYLNGTQWDGIDENCPIAVGDSSPSVTLSSPANGNVTTNNYTNFTCNATDDNQLANITFYWNYSGSFIANGTVNVSGVSNQTTFNRTNLNGTILWNCRACDNASQCSFASANYTVLTNYTAPDTTPQNITFNSQTPADITTANIFGITANITYNITDSTGINNNSVNLYYKTNNSQEDCLDYVNGSLYNCGYKPKSYTSNQSSTWLFTLDDNAVYPGIYNYIETTLEQTPHANYTLTSSNTYLKIRLFNVSNQKTYGVFELMARNASASTNPLKIYYCNSSYTNQDPKGTSFCTNFYNLPSTQLYNHTHSVYSSHYAIPFAINITSGTIGSVIITNTSYFLLRGNTGAAANQWEIYYITNISRNDSMQLTTNAGTSWTNFSGTINSHLHQYNGTARLWYYACANDTLNNSACSSNSSDLLDLAGLPPTAPNVYNPLTGVYSGNITINYTAAQSPNGYLISYYNISLLNTSNVFNKTIQSNNSLNLSYVWNSIGTSDGEYIIRVQACDNLSQCSYGFSENFTIDNTKPLWFNVSKNTTTVYNGDPVKFNTTWTNAALAGYIFSIKQNGTYWNSSYIPFSGTTNVSENISTIIAPAGTNVTWFFWANDTAGNSNQTDIQSFVVQSNPTSLIFSVNQTMYPQGRSPGMGYDIYIPFQARYLNNLASPIAGATCYVTNDETSDIISLTYNESSGNYTGNVSNYLMYNVVTFNATCSKTNYDSAINSTSTNVWWFGYIWEWNNLSYGFGPSDSATSWIRKQIPTGPLYTLTKDISAITGDNEVAQFIYEGAGMNYSIMRDYTMLGIETFRLNVSINDTSLCNPVLCIAILDSYLNEIHRECAGQNISSNTPTIMEVNISNDHTIRQKDYMALHLHLNCTANANVKVEAYYNYSGAPANIEIHQAKVIGITSYISGYDQYESNYTIGPNSTVNSSGKLWLTLNNTFSTAHYADYWYLSPILADYPNSIVNGTVYIYNSTGQLWASDNASAGAPNIATVYSDNRINWITETIPGNTAIIEGIQAVSIDTIRDIETLSTNLPTKKIWNISGYGIYQQLTAFNLTFWTNYSTYGVTSDWNFTANMTLNGITTDITNQLTFNHTTGKITFPMTNFYGAGVIYTVTASDITPPTVHLISPPNATPTNQSIQNFSCNISNIAIANLTLKIWNSTNSLIYSNTTNLTGVFNQTNWTYTLPYDNSFKWNCLGSDANGNSNYSSEGNYTITLDSSAPVITNSTSTPSLPLINNETSQNISVNFTSSEYPINLTFKLYYSNNTIAVSQGPTQINNSSQLPINFTIPAGLSDGNYYLNMTISDSLNNSNTTNLGTITVGTPTPPSVIILYPATNTVRQEHDYIAIMANITDSDGINSTKAEITYPNNTKINVSLIQSPQKDNFNSNTMGIVWKVENESIESGQTCIANIDTTVTDKAYTSISGDGSPNTDTYCSLIMNHQTIGDFDMNVTFNITNESGIDYAMLFKLTEISSSVNASKSIFMSIGNWTGYGRTYDVFVNDGNISDYISENATNDTSGKFRIKRVNNTFTFYTWNNSDNSWYEEVESEIDVYPGLFITLESESAETGWGNISVSWDDLETGISPLLYVGSFTNTSLDGDYNITIIANDTLGAVNNTEKTNFTIEEINDAPTIPFILFPTPDSNLNNIQTILWSNVNDEEGDSLQFNITLLNSNGSNNTTIINNYGNASSISYPWNTSLYADGNYSLRITVFENETAENYSISNTLGGNFTIDNTPPTILFVPPTETSGTTITTKDNISINVTASDSYLNNIEIKLYNSSGFLIMDDLCENKVVCFIVFDFLEDGVYYFNATAEDNAGNTNRTETRNITIDAAPDINLTSPEGNELNYNVIITTNYGSGIYDLNITLSGEDARNLFISGYNNSGCSEIIFESETNETIGSNDYAVSAGCMIFNNMTITLNATSGNYLYKCLDWNMTTLLCNNESNWTTAKLLTPGQTYNITINSTDPGFIEILQPNATLGKDTFISSGTPNANYGADSTFDIRGDDARRTLIEFNVSTIPSDAIIDSAILTLYATAKGSSDAIVNVYRVNYTWTEGTGTGSTTGNGATWNNATGTAAWTTAGGDFDTNIWNNTTITAINTFFDWNLTNLVQSIVNGTLVNYGIILRTTTAGSGTTSFASSDNINSTRWPELNVSYHTPDNSPNVTLISPIDNYYNSTSSPVNVTFQCNATDDINLKNISLYITNSTNLSFALNQTTSISGISNSTQWNLSLINGNYTWNCLAYDNASQTDWANTNRSLKINYTAPVDNYPNTTLVSPANGNVTTNNYTNFTCNATDDNQLANITFYWNYSGSFIANGTTPVSGISNQTSFNKTNLSNGAILWNCRACDNASQCNFASSNYTVTTNYTAPVNIAPNITYLSPITNTNPTEASSTPITFYSTMCDEDGVADLNDTSVKANFTRPGEATRENNSCILVSDINSTCANYSCTIKMWYFDGAGAWNVSVYGSDSSGLNATNTSTYFTYNLLQAMVIYPSNITFNVNASASNQTATNDPVIINNTGNYNMTNKIAVNAVNLLGETNSSEYLAAENFSIGIADNCAGTQLQNATDTNITGVILQAGNLSLGGGTGQEQLYYCLNEIGGVSAQTYSTQGYGSWFIKVVLSLVMISTAKKKKRKIIVDDLSIPVSIFIDKIGGLEALVKYLKENLELTYHEIALLLNRDDRTIWTAYNKSKIKMSEKLKVTKTLVYIPTSIFKNRELTIFEAIVVYLKEKEMKFSEIADLLSRDQRNIWTIHNRATKK